MHRTRKASTTADGLNAAPTATVATMAVPSTIAHLSPHFETATPAGVAVSKWGDKWAMVAGTAMVATVAVGAAFSPSAVVLAFLVLCMGGGWAFWQLARLAYVAEKAPLAQRG